MLQYFLPLTHEQPGDVAPLASQGYTRDTRPLQPD